jgi:transcriptional regulator with GAF, ATPase, and Fis domain
MPDPFDASAPTLLKTLQAVISRVAPPSQVLKTILNQAVSQTGADRGVFVEVGRTGALSYRVLYRFQREELTLAAGRYSSSIFARVLKDRAGVRVDNALTHPDFRHQKSVQDFRLVSILCMPIFVGDRIAALVHLESNTPGHFNDGHQESLQSLFEVAGSALATLQASQQVIDERDALQESENVAREELEESRELLSRDWSFGRFVGRTPSVRELAEQVGKAAGTDYPVLLQGETGTGKNILARVLHHSSSRARQTMVTVFCPSLEKGMVETELFGHKRGAFTGAISDRTGKVQAAERGTLFLDEIGELPAEIQPKLLRLLQEKAYERVGDPTERRADVRIIVATNKDLEQEVKAGRFRRDLFERLNFLPIRVAPLRERREDIPTLLRHFLDLNEAGRWIEISADATRYLIELDFTWPGNVRHLEHLAARLAMDRPSGPVTSDDVKRLLDLGARANEAETGGVASADLDVGLPALLAQAEQAWLQEATRRYAGLSRSELAAKLKIAESTLYKKLRLYGIED